MQDGAEWSRDWWADVSGWVQVSSGFKDYVLAPAYPDSYLPDPAYKGVTVECSGYCK